MISQPDKLGFLDESGAHLAPTVWGLSAQDLHGAFWKSLGLQVVERGLGAANDHRADGYLLVEPGGLVLFDFESTRVFMRDESLSCVRVRLRRQAVSTSEERVLADDDGSVSGIVRLYTGAPPQSIQVWVVRNHAIASAWSHAANRRSAVRAIRQQCARFKRGSQTLEGEWWLDPEDACGEPFIESLSRVWENPNASIRGIEQIQDQVWAPVESSRSESVCVGPLWLGHVNGQVSGPLFGPRVVWDLEPAPNPAGSPISVRDFEEVLSGAHRFAVQHRTDRGRAVYRFFKRTLDLTVSGVVLGLLSPLFLVICILIWLDDRGSFFFGHTRQSRGGADFKCWKFRTMCRDAEQMACNLEGMNICDGPQVYITNDPRVTRIGHVLRKYHIDELPQFWNVLRGQMSLVGPRPSPDRENQYCPVWREARLSVRPGITGLWQIERTRAPGMDFQEWIQFDIEYVRRASMRLDIHLLIRTALKLFSNK